MRKIYLIGEIDSDMAQEFFESVDKLVEASKKPIDIDLSSDGGSSMDALAIMEKLLSTQVRFNIHAYGRVQSAAVLIFAAGDYRTARNDTWFMVHEDELTFEGRTSNIKKMASQAEKEEFAWCQRMEELTGTPSLSWKNLSEAETYIKVDYAQALGLVDDIVEYKGKVSK